MYDHFLLMDWDSEFFGFKIAQVEKNFLLTGSRETCLKGLATADIDMAYYTSDFPLDMNSEGSYDFRLVSKRVQIKKELSFGLPLHDNIDFYHEQKPDSDLVRLAHRAGNFSRFLSDPKICPKKVKELYEIWITKSVEKKMASEVLVYKEKGQVKGFVTLIFDPPHGQTPLFAVSPDSEGKGISFSLMRAADSVLYQNGCSYYTSATQADNKAAVTIFRRHGFEIGPVVYVYHLWKKR